MLWGVMQQGSVVIFQAAVAGFAPTAKDPPGQSDPGSGFQLFVVGFHSFDGSCIGYRLAIRRAAELATNADIPHHRVFGAGQFNCAH